MSKRGRARAYLVRGVLLVAVLASGCALLRKGERLEVRYFSADVPVQGAHTERGGQGDIPLRLGRIAAASNLDERIVYRKGGVEVGYYDKLRWTEQPDNYLQRLLSRKLFERGRFSRVVSGPGPTLEATLLALEEQTGTPHLARATASFSLYDGQMSRVEQTFNVDIEVAADGEPGAQLANALVTALTRVAEQIVQRTEQVLSPSSPAVGVASP